MSRSRRSPRQEADDDAAYYDRLRGIEERRRDTEALKLGAKGVPESQLPPGGITPRMSSADQTIAADRMKRVKGRTLDDPTAPARVAGSSVPLDVNSPSRLQAGATAASPQQTTPVGNRFIAPTPLTSPMGNRATDASALKQNLQIAQNPGSFQSPMQPPPQVEAAAKPAAPSVASVGIGKTLTPAQGDAILGPRPVAPGANEFGTASVRQAKPGEKLTTATVTDTGVQRAGPFDENAARQALYKSHPAIFQAGTPENAAFVAHHKQYGAEAAYTGATALMATLNPSQGGPTPQTGKNDIGGAPTPEALATHDATMAAGQPSLPVQAGRAIAQSGNTVSNLGNAVANAPRAAANAIDSAISGVATGITGQKQTLNPIASAGRAVKSVVAPAVGAVADAGNAMLRNIPNPETPRSPSLADPTQPAPAPTAPAPVAEAPEEQRRKRTLPAFSMN